MQAQAMRVYQIAFSGRDAQGVLPMFTRITPLQESGLSGHLSNVINPSAAGF